MKTKVIKENYLPNPLKLVQVMISDFIKKPIFVWLDPNTPTAGTNNIQNYTVEFSQ